MNLPMLIHADSFQSAWANAILLLKANKWKLWNLVVQIHDPCIIDDNKHEVMRQFALRQGDIVEPNKVAYTIFPYKLYKPGITRERLYGKYWRYFDLTGICLMLVGEHTLKG